MTQLHRFHGDVGVETLLPTPRKDRPKKTLSDFAERGCLIREMQNHSDAQLLRQYAAQRSEAAFGEIVARHAGLVYSAALRQLESPGAPHPRYGAGRRDDRWLVYQQDE